MLAKELRRFAETNYLNEGHPEVLDMVRPLFGKLIADLVDLSDDAPDVEKLDTFRVCIEGLNELGDDYIETVERECFCDVLYQIGEIVGLDRKSNFVEKWRNTW